MALTFLSCASVFGGRDCAVSENQLAGPQFSMRFSQHIHSSDTKKSVIIMPPTGGANFIDNRYANEFCRAGYNVYIIKWWTDPNKPSETALELHQRDHERAQASISRLLEEIKTPFVGLLGTSLGGIYSAVAANYQDRINAVFMITSGIPVTEVIVNSDQELMRNLLNKRKTTLKFKGIEEYQKAVQGAFSFEPAQLGEKYKSKDIGVAIALNDTTVPTKNQLLLIDFFKPKKIIKYESSHFWGIIKTWLYSSGDIIDFFDESSQKQLQVKQ